MSEMQIDEAITELETIITTVRFILDIKPETEKENVYKLDNKQVQAIETVLSELDRLQMQETARVLGKLTDIKLDDIISDEYISKQKIRDKIEELKKEEKKALKGLKGQDRYLAKQEYMFKISILEELLNESGQK